MQHSECFRGQRVQFRTPDNPRYHGKLGTVNKVNPKKIRVTLDNGMQLDALPYFLEPAPAGTAPAVPIPVTTEPYVMPPVMGTIVKSDSPKIRGLHVVTADTTLLGRPAVRIVKLGGDGNRYWRVLPSSLTVVSLEEALLGVEAQA